MQGDITQFNQEDKAPVEEEDMVTQTDVDMKTKEDQQIGILALRVC